MFNRLHKLLATGIVAGMLIATIGAVPVSAAEIPGATPGDSPANAVAPGNDWTVLQPGESRWYSFDYDFNDLDVDGEETDPSRALIEVETNVADSVSFAVWTAQGLRERVTDDEVNPLGVGSAAEDDDKTLIWAGSAGASETFFVVVQNERSAPSYYEIAISGPDVSFPAAAVPSDDATRGMTADTTTETTMAEPIVMEAGEAKASATAVTAIDPGAPGYSPDNAATPTDSSVTLTPGGQIWYAFQFDFEEGDPERNIERSRALVELEIEQVDTVEFEIWTPEQVQLWKENREFDPMGAGSVLFASSDNEDRNTLVWAGRDQPSGTYYVLVENESAAPATFNVSIGGTGVYFTPIS